MRTLLRISQAAMLAALFLVGLGPQGAHAQVVNGGYAGATAGIPAQQTPNCPPPRVAQYGVAGPQVAAPVPYGGYANPNDTVNQPLPIPRIVNGQATNVTVPFAYGSANYPYGYPDASGRVMSPYGNPQGVQIYSPTARAIPTAAPNPNVYPYFQGPAGTAATYPATGMTGNPQSAAELIQYYHYHPAGGNY